MYQVCGSLFQQASAAVSKENNQLLCKEMDHSKVLSMALNPSFNVYQSKTAEKARIGREKLSVVYTTGKL